jgi:hypothetical protein
MSKMNPRASRQVYIVLSGSLLRPAVTNMILIDKGRISFPHQIRNGHIEVCDPSYVLATNPHSIKKR